MKDLSNKTALVTGASSGLGIDFAHLLAQRGANLILVARRKERLEEVAEELRAAHGVEVHVMSADLAAPDAAVALHREVQEAGLEVAILVNNAGFGLYGDFVESSWESLDTMLHLDIVTLTQLTHVFVKDMVARNEGWILQVASIAAYQPTPTYAAYGAAKSFVLHFGEALAHELRNTNVKVSVLSPGVTRTEFFEVAGQTLTLYQRLAIMDSRPVAAVGIRALFRGVPSRVAGWLNKLTVFTIRFVPRRLMATVADLVTRSRATSKALPNSTS